MEGYLALIKEQREENDKLQEEIERLTELCNKYEEEHKTAYEIWKKAINVIVEIREYIGLSEEERKHLSIYDVNGIGILEIIDKLESDKK